jgi:hypothetical protein
VAKVLQCERSPASTSVTRKGVSLDIQLTARLRTAIRVHFDFATLSRGRLRCDIGAVKSIYSDLVGGTVAGLTRRACIFPAMAIYCGSFD